MKLIKFDLKNNNLYLKQLMNLGGGSALLSMPIDGLKLSDKLEIIKILTNNGADIRQLNIVRKTLSKVKGGKLAQISTSSQVFNLNQIKHYYFSAVFIRNKIM